MYWEADEMLLACFAISLAFAIFLEVSIVSGAKKKKFSWPNPGVCIMGELTGSLDSIGCVN